MVCTDVINEIHEPEIMHEECKNIIHEIHVPIIHEEHITLYKDYQGPQTYQEIL